MNPEQSHHGLGPAEVSFNPELERQKRTIALVNVAVDNYASHTLPILRQKVRAGESKAEIKLGEPKNYKRGDIEVEIDPIGELILKEIVDSLSLSAEIHGEHQSFRSPTGETRVYFEIDPFDNTSEYQAGLDTPPWTVLSAYDENGSPIASLVGNIKENDAYLLKDGRVFRKDFDSGEMTIVKKSERTSLFDDRSVLASYTGSSEYSSKLNRNFLGFIDSRPDRAIFYGGGGAFIYGHLAAGAVDAYVMFDEPYEEIDPGAAIALAAGCVVGHYDINKDEWVDYTYNPNRGDVKTAPGIFIAAANEQLRDELINHYREQQTTVSSATV